MPEDIFKEMRNSKLELKSVYFWTSTIKDWKKLLDPDKYKLVLIDSLKHLVEKKKITVFAFVIMPNHIHLIWRLDDFNGKELPHASFNKFTAHEIIKDLKNNHVDILPIFKVEDNERNFRVWQRDPLAVLMDSKGKLEQKLGYIHNNPLHERWNLACTPEKYRWSSAKFYETGEDEFGFLAHYMDVF